MSKTRRFIKTFLPGTVPALRAVRSLPRKLDVYRPQSMRAVFSTIYEQNSWGDLESVSGTGSTLERTAVIRESLPSLLTTLGTRTIVDAACGDFNWMQHVDLDGIDYYGVDVVPELIARNREKFERPGLSFLSLNIVNDSLPSADTILCRDCFIHLSFRHIRQAINNFKKTGAKFLLATTHTTITDQPDIRSGTGRLVNLQVPPLSFPMPFHSITENATTGKVLGVWRLNDL